MNRPAFSVVPLVFALAGCPSPKPPDDAAGDAIVALGTADLGTGQLAWEPLAPSGTHVELIHGPQGGYHIFGRVRFDRLGPDVYVRFRVTPSAGGAPLNDPTERVHLVEGRNLMRTAAGWEAANAMLVVLTAVHGPAEVVGRSFRLEATITPSPAVPETPGVTVSRDIVIVDET